MQQKQMLDIEAQEIRAQQGGLQMTAEQVKQISAGKGAAGQQLAGVEHNLEVLSQQAADLQKLIDEQQRVFGPIAPAPPAANGKPADKQEKK